MPVLAPDEAPPIFESLAITLYLLEQDQKTGSARQRLTLPMVVFFHGWRIFATTFYDAACAGIIPNVMVKASVHAAAEAELDVIYDHIDREPMNGSPVTG